MGKKRVSIKARIVTMVLALVFTVFLVVALMFNLLIGNYIQKSAADQLENTVAFIGRSRGPFLQQLPEAMPDEPGGGPETGVSPVLSGMPRGLGGRAEMFVVNASYEAVLTALGNTRFSLSEEAEALREKMQAESLALDTGEVFPVKTAHGEYYIVSSPLGERFPVLGSGGGMRYVVSFVNMTEISRFALRINFILTGVMVITGLISVLFALLISERISRPIRELRDFSSRIGQGDFSSVDCDYRERELSELAASMNGAAAQLQGYDSEQKTFFQNVSHELRTPLQSIRSNAEGISYGILEPKKSCDIIVSETDRLGDMIDDILYLSRITSSSSLSLKENCDLREILSTCAEQQRSVAASRGLRLVYDFDDGPVELNCDEKQIARAFSNLISNALRYARGRILLGCAKHEGRIVITVTDDGPGISDKDMPHIFERFYKGGDGKHGIGLAIVKSIILQHNGQITVASSPAGTSFQIIFSQTD